MYRRFGTAPSAGGNAANGGDYQRVSDPWVTISPNGIAYKIGLSSSGGVLQPGSSSAVLVSRSNDGGSTWENPVTLIQDGSQSFNDIQFFNDQESITADPTDARFVYAAWDRLASVGGGPAIRDGGGETGAGQGAGDAVWSPSSQRRPAPVSPPPLRVIPQKVRMRRCDSSQGSKHRFLAPPGLRTLWG